MLNFPINRNINWINTRKFHENNNKDIIATIEYDLFTFSNVLKVTPAATDIRRWSLVIEGATSRSTCDTRCGLTQIHTTSLFLTVSELSVVTLTPICYNNNNYNYEIYNTELLLNKS